MTVGSGLRNIHGFLPDLKGRQKFTTIGGRIEVGEIAAARDSSPKLTVGAHLGDRFPERQLSLR
jgi:hypothetical protein